MVVCSRTAPGVQLDELDGDLDLQVTDSMGNYVCYSGSYDSSWELCDFAATPGETYQVRLVKFATVQSFTYVGIAWQQYSSWSD